MTPKQEAALRQALEFIKQVDYPPYDDKPVIAAIDEALAEQTAQTEFKPDWMNYQQGLADGAAAERAEVERLKLLCEEMLRELYVYRASEYLKDVTASIRARIKK